MPEIVESILGVIAAIVGFAIILYFAYITTKVVGRRYGTSARTGSNLKLIESLPLGNDKNIMIVKAADKVLLLGVTAQHVELISELDEQTLEIPLTDSTVPSFKEILKQNIGLTKNHMKKENPKEASSNEKQTEKE